MAHAKERHRVSSAHDALHEAVRLLKDEFGDVDQNAAVHFAEFLFACREREDFLERHGDAPEDLAYRAG